MQKLKATTAGVRRGTGTRLSNPATKEIVYTPPEGEDLIRAKLGSLEKFIHEENETIDPLIKMALIHYQFEAIHPFDDGNGRTGRILNVLYLVHKDLLSLPVLYLSAFIIQHKNEYYRLLREITEKGNWLEWIQYMLSAISKTTALSLEKIKQMQALRETVTEEARAVLKSSYNRNLIDLLFVNPYVKIKILQQHGIGHRQTASTYLQKLAKADILHPLRLGKEIYYINHRLVDIISN